MAKHGGSYRITKGGKARRTAGTREPADGLPGPRDGDGRPLRRPPPAAPAPEGKNEPAPDTGGTGRKE